MWLWVRQGETTYGPATAQVTSIRWTMGDGPTVTCTGPGTPYRGNEGMPSLPTAGTATPAPVADSQASGSR